MALIKNDLYLYMDESSITPFLKCKLCNKPFVDPVTTEDGKTFCRTCIVTFYNPEATKLPKFTTVTEKLVLDMLDSLFVKCKKCGQTNLKRSDLKAHENITCQEAMVSCKAADIKCPWIGERKKLQGHLDECKYEPLRTALEFLINQNAQLKSRIESLERKANE